MRKIFTYAVIAVSLLSCVASKQTPSAIGLVKLENYFLKDSAVLLTDTNYFVVTSDAAFEKMFGAAKTGNNKIVKPGFDGQWVVAAALKATNKPVVLGFEKAEIIGKATYVYLQATGEDNTLSYTSVPLALATVPKSGDVRSIHFIVNGNDVKSIPVK